MDPHAQTPCAQERFDISLGSEGAVQAVATTPRHADAALVFAHGAGAGMDHSFMTAVAEGLAERRIACLRFQFPYMQAGKRRVDAPPVAHATVRAAVSVARERWPNVRLFAGGKSFGGRMTSQAQSIQPFAGVDGLIFLSFPLHPAGKPSIARAEHLALVKVPMLFVHGSRDALAEPTVFRTMVSGLEEYATVVNDEDADHGLHVLRRSGRTDQDVLDGVLDAILLWTQAWQIDGFAPVPEAAVLAGSGGTPQPLG